MLSIRCFGKCFPDEQPLVVQPPFTHPPFHGEDALVSALPKKHLGLNGLHPLQSPTALLTKAGLGPIYSPTVGSRAIAYGHPALGHILVEIGPFSLTTGDFVFVTM